MKNHLLTGLLILVFSATVLFPQDAGKTGKFNPDKLLSMEFVEADLQGVLRLLAKQNHINLIVNEDITGTVTVHFSKVSFKNALDAILKSNGYDYIIQENILIVKPIDSEMLGELETRVFNLDYASAYDITVPLENLLSPKGKIQIFSESSRLSQETAGTTTAETAADVLVISEIPSNLANLERLIKELDVPPVQVMIGVKFIETILSESEDMGIDWSIKARLMGGPTIATESGLVTPGGTGAAGGVGTGVGTGGVGAGGGAVSGLGLGLIKELNIAILSLQDFEILLDFLRSTGRSKLLSDPRISTLDKQRANINVETEITVIVPTVTAGTAGALATEQAEKITIAISLSVLPHVHKNGQITLAVEPTVEAITGFSGPKLDQPIISRRTATTQVRVNNGETIAIGGLIKEDIRKVEKKVPFLGSIPVIGRLLFTSKSDEIEKSDLLIFITPHIIHPSREPLTGN